MDELRSLNMFITAVKQGSFKQAAMKMGVTSAAISKSIAQLEQQLDVRLFNRTTRNIHLTAEGQLFYDKVSVSLEALGAAYSDLAEMSKGPSGVLRISTSTAFGKSVLMPLVARFLAQYPNVRIELLLDDGGSDLIQDGIDIEIRRGGRKHVNGSTVSRRLCDFPLALVASPRYLERKGMPRVPADLHAHDCISVRFSQGGMPDWILSERPQPGQRRRDDAPSYVFHPQGRLTMSEQFDLILDAVLAGMGITAAPLHNVWSHLCNGTLKTVLPDYQLFADDAMVVIYPHRQHLPLKTRAFIDHLFASVSQDKILNGVTLPREVRAA